MSDAEEAGPLVKCPACGADVKQAGEVVADHANQSGAQCVASGWTVKGEQQ
jgi:hypothetical protein